MGGLCAVIGRPVRHSLSPAMHQAVFDAGQPGWRFTRFELVDSGVSAAVAAMGPLDIAGYAVTMPHKEAAAAAVDAVDTATRSLRSVNTVVRRSDGSTYGTSTDGRGFVESVRAAGHDLEGLRVAVLGAGAAARSIIHALDTFGGVAEIVVVNRSRANAEVAVEAAGCATVGAGTDVAEVGLVVNATSVGMGTDELPLDPALLRPGQIVADIVYHPLDTALLRAARTAGADLVDGLGMLVHQAVLQQELWTGRRPDPALMRSAAEAELRRRVTPR